jgi:hypothetical protein
VNFVPEKKNCRAENLNALLFMLSEVTGYGNHTPTSGGVARAWLSDRRPRELMICLRMCSSQNGVEIERGKG